MDSESYSGILASAGWATVSAPPDRGILVLNTCAFIGPAVRESLDALAEAAAWRAAGPDRRVVLAGCLPARYPDDGSGIDGVDLVVPPGGGAALARMLGGVEGRRRKVGRGRHRYLRISDGCRCRCSYCVIPTIRGPYVQRPSGEIRAEAARLAGSGASEIVLIAQDSSAWSEPGLGIAQLAAELAGRHEGTWFRILYLNPCGFPEDLPAAMADHPNLVPYVDLPVQHASDRILARMGRGYGRRDLSRILDLLESCPVRPAVRMSVIAGYPGEEHRDFGELLSLLSGLTCCRSLCVFPYSDEEGSGEHDRGIPRPPGEDTAERILMLESLGESFADGWGQRLAGRELEFLVETPSRGRSPYDAPGVDGTTRFTAAASGPFTRATVTGSCGLDMEALPVDRSVSQ